MPAPKVYNQHHGDALADAIYIGRESPWMRAPDNWVALWAGWKSQEKLQVRKMSAAGQAYPPLSTKGQCRNPAP
jgi:hypothetical protein